MIAIVAFDFDGVLVNSLPIKDEGFRSAFLMFGPEMAQKAKDYHVAHRGIFRQDKFRRILHEVIGIPATPLLLETLESNFISATRSALSSVPLMTGANDMLASLPCRGKYIVSAAPTSEVIEIAGKVGIANIFSHILGGPKKKSDHLAHIAELENCSPREILMVGDALADYTAATMAGCHFVGFVEDGTPSPFPETVRVISKLTELRALLNNSDTFL